MKKFFEYFYHLQNLRFLWFIMFFMSISLILLAHNLFQNYLYMKPCEQCVYIRFAFLCMALGGIFAFINPRKILLKLLGYLFGLFGSIYGFIHSYVLRNIYIVLNSDNPFNTQNCEMEPGFPFGLQMDVWFPSWFMPTGSCGDDIPSVPVEVTLNGIQGYLVELYSNGWYLIPQINFANMAECCMFAFLLATLILVFMSLSFLLNILKEKEE